MTQDVFFDELTGEAGDVGVITLNRPEVLNSLNHNMITAMFAQLKKWASSQKIKAVVIKAVEGRAFCAGGDLRLTYERARENSQTMTAFFREEYELNRFIFHFNKPYIALLDGITMGGGVGISIHGSHRIATEKLMFAMPETGIGLFPDVGGTYFLPRLPKKIGYYLGLTGARIHHLDATYFSITHAFVEHKKIKDVLDAITHTAFVGEPKKAVSQMISSHATQVTTAPLNAHIPLIEKIFSAESIEEIVIALNASDDPFAKETLQQLMKKSPTSLKVTLRALQLGQNMHFDDCMKQELKLVTHFLKQHDFPEGIRAVIIDKDQKPIWQPGQLSGVKEADILQYFR